VTDAADHTLLGAIGEQQLPDKAPNRAVTPRSAPETTWANENASNSGVGPQHEIDADHSVLDVADVDVDRRAEIALDVIRTQRRRWARANRRPPALRPREALQALLHEALVVMVADPANYDDRQRLVVACQRIHAIASEVIRDER